jgi:pimeloyl-ACP methyl ester carboxylesterase
MCKKILMGMFVVMVLLFLVPGQGHSSLLDWGKMSTILTPGNDQRINTLPVKITIQFNEAANPSTFKAWLNGKNITSKFQKIEGGMTAMVGPEDGLRIAANYPKVNALLTSVRGFRKELDMDAKVFFAKVEAMQTIGPQGGVVEVTDPASPLYGVRVEIPSGALTASRAISIAERENPPLFENGSSGIGTAVEIGPTGTIFENPIKITLPYNDNELTEKNILGEDFLSIFTFDPSGVWIPIGPATVDKANKTVTAETNHLSTDQINGPRVVRHRRSQTDPTTQYYPVLFIHGVQALFQGIGNGPDTFGDAFDLLYAEDVDVWYLEYDSHDYIERSAQVLSAAIKTIKDLTLRDKVNVIAHSMGGLVTRQYLQKMPAPGSHNDVRKLMMIGTPNHGSNFALLDDIILSFFRLAPSFSQMYTFSPFIDGLNSTLLPKGLQIELLYGLTCVDPLCLMDSDGVVTKDSAILCPERCNDPEVSYHEHSLIGYYHTPIISRNWLSGIAKISGSNHSAYPYMRDFAKDPIAQPGTWSTPVVFADISNDTDIMNWPPSFAIGVNGQRHMVYSKSDNYSEIVYVSDAGTTVLARGEVDWASISVDPQGRPHVIYLQMDDRAQMMYTGLTQ